MRLDTSALLGLAVGIAVVTASSLAKAQGDDTAPAAPPPEPVTPAPTAAPAAPPPPAPPPAPGAAQSAINVQTAAPAPARTPSDHDSVVGSFGIGYLGRRSILIAGNLDPNAPNALPLDEVEAPVIGLRYWVTELVGIDAGVGFWTSGGKTKVTALGNSNEQDDQGFTAFIFHGGVPLSLASAGHFSFQVVPEANVGFASSKIDGGDGDDTKLHGFHFDVGARAGAEIHFGFIGVPQLALQASIGARYSYDKVKLQLGDDKVEVSRRSFGTSVGDNPWNIFTSNVAALYYF